MEQKLGIVLGQMKVQSELINRLQAQLSQAQAEYLRLEGAKIALEEIISEKNAAAEADNSQN